MIMTNMFSRALKLETEPIPPRRELSASSFTQPLVEAMFPIKRKIVDIYYIIYYIIFWR